MTRTKYIAAEKAWVAMVDLKVGDKVLVCRDAKRKEFGWDNTWIEEMDEFICGDYHETVATVKRIDGDGDGIQLVLNGEDYAFPFFVLEKVVKELPANIKISSSYEVEFKANGSIEVGCQTIPFDLLHKIYETAKNVNP